MESITPMGKAAILFAEFGKQLWGKSCIFTEIRPGFTIQVFHWIIAV
jgi:hypothetical protein